MKATKGSGTNTLFSRHGFGWALLIGLFLVYGSVACNSFDQNSDEQTSLRFSPPPHFPEVRYTVDNNPVTEAGFDLGKALFFDPLLSADGSVSCSSCHQQGVAFADPQHRFSVGIEGRSGIRNAPGLANLAFQREFLWDGGIPHLDFVPVNAIENELEMGETMVNVVRKLQNHESYPAMFNRAFGRDTVTSGLLLQALSQFTIMMISAGSPYDDFVTGSETALNADEQRGLATFRTNCGTCHSGELFSNFNYANNGLDSSFERDPGRALISESAADSGLFKIPSLRNVGVTAPYMHDGRFSNLRQVLDHYSEGIRASATLHPGLPEGGLQLSEGEKDDIIAFLNALTDREFLTNPIFRQE